MAETIKSKARREREGWYSKYIHLPGIDIGSNDDPISEQFDKWDYCLGDGDATYMEGVAENKYATVYASHIIEHLYFAIDGIRNWYRITAPGGHLIIIAPSRDLYEKKRTLPSLYNGDHKTMWNLDKCDPPNTFSLRDVVEQALEGETYQICECRVLDENWKPTQGHEPCHHSSGEYSLEIIIKKL